jgi:uncharacterized protein (TIGR00266 family)
MADAWYYARGQERVGPMGLAELAKQLPQLQGERTLVFGPGMTTWVEARTVPQLAGAMRPSGGGSGGMGGGPPVPSGGRRSDEVDYQIFGEEMQYVEITLDPGEMVIAEAGGMMYMTPGIVMETVFGDPSAQQKQGFFSKVMTAGKRLVTGESLFMTTFTAGGSGREKVGFASPYPGKILPMDLKQLGGELICQKDSFLCAARGVQVGIAFQKKLGVGLFGGEGFIMQRLTGDGLAMVHAGGTLMKRTLHPGEMLKVDTGCIVALTPSIQYDIQFVGGIKNTLFGGEGLFFATVTGPGEVWLQSLPFSRLAGRIMGAVGGGKGEGSILGKVGDLLGGD